MCSETKPCLFLNRVVFFLSFSLSIVSCTVKEDRTGCPCFLTLDLGGIGSAGLLRDGFDSLGIHVSAGDRVLADQYMGLEDGIKEYVIAVPKTGVDVAVICADGGRYSKLDGFTVDSGSPWPRIHMSAESIDTDRDEMKKYITLHKNWCRLELMMKSYDYGVKTPFRVRLVGNVNGYYPSGKPREGGFDCMSELSLGKSCYVNVPRQIDDSLWMEVMFQDTDDIRAFPIGKYIAASGYDWNAVDLDDVSVEMNFSKSGLSFTVYGWKKTYGFELTI